MKKTSDGYEIKGRNVFYLGYIVIGGFMFCSGAYCIVGLFPIEGAYDVFGLIFMLVWLSVVGGMMFFGLSNYTAEVSVTHNGIYSNNLFQKRYIGWHEVRDFGITYDGHDGGGTNFYILYFSPKELPLRKSYKKKLRGRMIKARIIGDDYYNITDELFAYCSEFTETGPFTSGTDRHFI